NRLPNFTIANTNAGTAATTIGTLMDPTTRFWSLAGVIAQPIFDGGNLRHRQRAAEATYRQTAALYRSAVINAVQNVNDALQALFYDQQAVATAYKAYRAAQTSLEITRKQIALGDSSRTALFVTQLTYQQARFNLIQAQANQLTDSVALIQALGGGWQEIKAPFKD
ncbi:MAG: TolC family protein, partial [Legionella sp.]|nr:TolC family protein [Legionella sp.]